MFFYLFFEFLSQELQKKDEVIASVEPMRKEMAENINEIKRRNINFIINKDVLDFLKLPVDFVENNAVFIIGYKEIHTA